MRKTISLLSLILFSAMCSACSETAQNETSQAANAIGSDIEQAGDNAANAASNALNATGNAAANAGNAIKEGIKDATH